MKQISQEEEEKAFTTHVNSRWTISSSTSRRPSWPLTRGVWASSQITLSRHSLPLSQPWLKHPKTTFRPYWFTSKSSYFTNNYYPIKNRMLRESVCAWRLRRSRKRRRISYTSTREPLWLPRVPINLRVLWSSLVVIIEPAFRNLMFLHYGLLSSFTNLINKQGF